MVVQKGGMDRDNVLRLARDALGVTYGEVVDTWLLARLLSRCECGKHGPRPSLEWEGSDVDAFQGRLFPAPL